MRRLAAVITSLALASCVNGIPPPDGWEPPKPAAPCKPLIVDGERKGCADRMLDEWRRQRT